jgi:hypothetical protein
MTARETARENIRVYAHPRGLPATTMSAPGDAARPPMPEHFAGRTTMPLPRHSAAAALLAAMSWPAGAARAQATAANLWPIGTSIGGTAVSANSASRCQVNGGPTALTTGQQVFIALQASYLPPNANPITFYPTFYFGSGAHLIFRTATAGKVVFDTYNTQLQIPQPPKPPEQATSFSDYSAVRTALPPTLKVQFLLTLGDCSVMEQAIFHQP